ncbi:DsbC family protein [Methyloglobulus sp.]|uniref:DsbC family protein n=1 Tax=Methyloglobulus sp. TaxID=2518622 RepID=UPI0032B722AC
MKKITQITGLLLSMFMLPFANADEAAIKQALGKSMPTAKIESIKPSEIKGVYEVVLGSSIYYVSEDGKYLLQGRLVDVANRTDLTEQKLGATRKAALERIGTDNMIVFKPKIAKYKVSIFTDIDCGYCRKLHSEIDQYLAEGITIQYLFFPRAGKGSDSYDKAVSVWCAKDRNAALTAAKKDHSLEKKTCVNPVDKHMQLAAEFEVKGTPMIVTENGNIYPGYLPAKQLLEALQGEKTSQ